MKIDRLLGITIFLLNREKVSAHILADKFEVSRRTIQSIEKEYDNGDFILNMHVPESEHLWFGTLMALENKAVVLEPETLKKRLCERAKEILEVYE